MNNYFGSPRSRRSTMTSFPPLSTIFPQTISIYCFFIYQPKSRDYSDLYSPLHFIHIYGLNMAALVAFAPSALLALRLASSAPFKARSALQFRSLRTYSASSYSSGGVGGEDGRWQLVLYSKPGCCLCDGLKEKLDAALSLAGGPHSLLSVDLQVSVLSHHSPSSSATAARLINSSEP